MTDETGLVLVVDDNEMNRDMLSRRLRRQKYTVEVAADGEEALNMIRAKTYDLVLLDIMMPRISGYEVLEQIKASEEMAYLPVIMISAVDELDSVVRCIEMGAEDYLFKPFNPVLLKARVSASLEKGRLRRNLVSGSQVDVSALQTTLESMQQDLDGLLAATSVLSPEQQQHLARLQEHVSDLSNLLDD